MSRKQQVLEWSEAVAPDREKWVKRASFFHAEDLNYLRYLIPKGSRVLELGCGTGHVLAALEPSHGVGVDFSSGMLEVAKTSHPSLRLCGADIEGNDLVPQLNEKFDYILCVDTIGSLDDCQAMLESLHDLCTADTRLVVAYYSHLWQPALRVAEWLGLRARPPASNVLSPADVALLLQLSGFEVVKSEQRILCPVSLLGIGRLLNRFIAPLPIIRQLGLRHYTVCRSRRVLRSPSRSASVIIPARNERGNIEAAVRRLPPFADDIEIIFIEGHSKDGTWDEIQRVIKTYPNVKIRAAQQQGIGKADAVQLGFDMAQGDVLMILDADLTMPPEQLGKFWSLIASGDAEFVNGTRLIYEMDDGAMRFLNLIANNIFSRLFSWLLNQRLTDTLCGTKVISRDRYKQLEAGRSYFGNFDPFGDFDLIFGAAKLNLKIVEVPVRYAARSYGTTQISRFRHGLLLLRMVAFSYFRMKAL